MCDAKLTVVGRRADALTLAYRVEIAPDVVRHLQERHDVARQHGRAAVRVGTLWGELRYLRNGGASTWHVRNTLFRVRLELNAPGRVEATPLSPGEPGWTFEIVWSAQTLAEIGVRLARLESRRIAQGLGHVFGARTRRFDLCADVAGWGIRPEDATCIIRRSRAKQTQHAARAEQRGAMLHERREITGITICPGGALMCRIYDKRAELEDKSEVVADAAGRAVRKRDVEEARWHAAGWDGQADITRVEFQIRGDAIRELGLRDPEAPFDPRTGEAFHALETILDRVWQRCLSWVRLVVHDASRPSRCSDDPRWRLLRTVTFTATEPPDEHGRARLRGGASVEQGLGCALSILGMRGLLARPLARCAPGENADRALRAEVATLFEKTGAIVATHLVERWGSTRGLEHLAIVHDAVRERFATA